MKPNQFDPHHRHQLHSRRQFLTRSGYGLAGLGIGGALAGLPSRAAEEITISTTAKGRTPIFLRGYSGEAADVLRFDLEIQGFEVVADIASAHYELTGSNDGQVEGRLVDSRTKAELSSPRFQGASIRALAHALSDDVVLKVTGKNGIARTKIAFKGGTGSATEVYVADYDGAKAVAVTADNKLVDSPAWVPGKLVLLYTSYINGYADILQHDLNTGMRKVFAEFPGINLGPAVSPDGKRVAMILSKDGGGQSLYVCDIDGDNLKRLTTDRSSKSSPTWSPDGNLICFVSGIPKDTFDPGLYIIPANGGPRRLVRTPAFGTASEPDWSPDGKWIAYSLTASTGTGRSRIYRVPATGGEAKPLIDDPDPAESFEHPSWAPNSRTLVFLRQVGERRVLSLLDAETKVTKTLSINEKGSEPAWAR